MTGANQDPETAGNSSAIAKLAWLPIPIFLLAIVALRAADMRGVYEAPRLLFWSQFVFVTISSGFVVYLSGKSFRARGEPGMLLLVCGATFLGLSGVVATSVAGNNPNTSTTIHNTCVWAASLCHLIGVTFSIRRQRVFLNTNISLLVGMTGTLLAILAMVFASHKGWMPTFFVQGEGGTLVRRMVLGSAVAMFGFSGIAMLSNRSHSPFARWYGLALVLFAIGLLGVLIQVSVGGVLGWTGRAAQCLSGVYMLAAALAATRGTGLRDFPSLTAKPNNPWVRYTLAVFFVAAAVTIRCLFAEVLGTRAITITLYPAVILASLYGGRRAGLLATVLAALAMDFFWTEPIGQFGFGAPADWLVTALFLATSFPIILIIEAMRTAQSRADAAEAETRLSIERERTERARYEGEKRVANILNSITAGYQVIDGDGRFTEFNAAARKMFAAQGLNADALIGKHIFNEAFPALRETPTGQSIGGALTKRVPTEVENLYEPWQRWFAVHNYPMPDGGVATFFDDITERKRAEAALRAREEELETIINGTPFMLTRSTRDLHYRFVSRAYAEMIGRKPEEIVGKPISEIMGDEGFKMIWPHIEKVLQGRGVEYESDVHFKEVGFRSLRVVYTPDKDEQGNVEGWIASILDVTERKRAEEALREAHQQLASRAVHLEKLVEQRTAKLNETIGDLESFSYSIVHDLRAPLRAMQSFAHLLADECGGLSPSAHDYVKRITTAAERMDRLIHDVLSYSRVTRSELPLGPVDAGGLLRGMLETYPSFQPPHAEIELEGPFPPLHSNEAALTQCISNLLGNAVKFVEPGVKPRVRVWAETREGWVRLVFQDNGIGIEKAAQERVFQMFERLSKRYEGTGVGLAIVKKAVEKMGGRIGLESEPGQGSTFWLEFARPVDTAEGVAAQGGDF